MGRRKQKDAPGQGTFGGFLDGIAKRARVVDREAIAKRLFYVVVALSGLGLLVGMAYHAPVLEPEAFQGKLLQSALFRGAGFCALLIGFRLGPAGLRPLLPACTLVALVLLALCFVPGIGVERNGSHRWVRLGLEFQPSELARLVVVMWIADRCVRLGPRVRELKRGVLPMLALGLTFFGLVMIETDVGSALLLLCCALSTMWMGGARPAFMLGAMAIIGGGTLGFAALTMPYARARLMVFTGELRNDQVMGATQAISSGEWWGSGLAQGRARFEGVPYLESDYVLAQIGEELGLFGMLLVLVLFLAFLWYGLRLVLSIPERYEALVAFGLLLSVALQAMLHAQVVAGLAPPKGINLPFLSAGGSSLVVSSLAVGLALGATRRPASERTSCTQSNAMDL